MKRLTLAAITVIALASAYARARREPDYHRMYIDYNGSLDQ